jgi:hypothetical protein
VTKTDAKQPPWAFCVLVRLENGCKAFSAACITACAVDVEWFEFCGFEKGKELRFADF